MSTKALSNDVSYNVEQTCIKVVQMNADHRKKITLSDLIEIAEIEFPKIPLAELHIFTHSRGTCLEIAKKEK